MRPVRLAFVICALAAALPASSQVYRSKRSVRSEDVASGASSVRRALSPRMKSSRLGRPADHAAARQAFAFPTQRRTTLTSTPRSRATEDVVTPG
jgi:hypothetical protein